MGFRTTSVARAVPFSDPGFLAKNVQDAIVEAKQGGAGVAYSVEILGALRVSAGGSWTQKVGATARVRAASFPYVLRVSGGGVIQTQSQQRIASGAACVVEAL